MINPGAAHRAEGRRNLDGEHRRQLQLFTTFVDAVRSGRDGAQVSEVLQQLVDFTDVHFMSEQMMMRLFSYPYYDAHVAEHDRLIGLVRDLASRCAAGESGDAAALAGTIRESLVGHTERSDRAFADWLAERNEG